jgi:hypothetical protein
MKSSLVWLTASFPVKVVCILALSSVACRPREAPRSEGRMGDPTVAGSLTFNVVEAKRRSQLDGFPTPRMPSRDFLLVRLTITNGGGADATIPYLKLQNAQGRTFTEEENGSGVDGWMGMLRRIPPAQTEDGWLLFDVPANSYKLRVTDGAVENEHVAYISIPLSMQTDSHSLGMP